MLGALVSIILGHEVFFTKSTMLVVATIADWVQSANSFLRDEGSRSLINPVDHPRPARLSLSKR